MQPKYRVIICSLNDSKEIRQIYQQDLDDLSVSDLVILLNRPFVRPVQTSGIQTGDMSKEYDEIARRHDEMMAQNRAAQESVQKDHALHSKISQKIAGT